MSSIKNNSSVSAAAIALEDGTSQHRWEASGEATWDSAVQEDAEGNIISSSNSETAAEAIRRRRKRLEQTDYAQKRKRFVRDMVRYLYIVIDASRWMRTKDPVLPPGTRLEVTIDLLQEFIREYFDQNPLSHLGFIILRDGEAEILSPLSSNAKVHQVALQSFGRLAASEPPNKGGEFSLQNGLEVAGRSLGHQPRYGSREIVVLFAALSTCDHGHIWTETLPRLQAANIRVSSFALSAELYVCRKLAEETGGVSGVCFDKAHWRDWLLTGQTTPPPSSNVVAGCEMILMGFPTRTSGDVPTLVHSSSIDTKLLARTAYVCPQCQAKHAALPTDCLVCGLKLVLAPHLARSFHHLFPIPPFAEVPIDIVLSETNSSPSSPLVISSNNMQVFTMTDSLVVSSKGFDRCCFACLKMIGTTVLESSGRTPNSTRSKEQNRKNSHYSLSGEEILRFQCPDCQNVFCADCDAYLHETLHNCPGCL
jgi:transcription initiation factor TFIIH subunit 2